MYRMYQVAKTISMEMDTTDRQMMTNIIVSEIWPSLEAAAASSRPEDFFVSSSLTLIAAAEPENEQ